MDRRKDSIKGLMKLKMVIDKIQRGLFSSESRKDADDGEIRGATKVPNDVKEGHFAVVAVKGGEPKRFVLELSHLSNPEFLRLLEQAKMEYGFQQKGVLAVPCRPEELQNVLKYKRNRRISTEWKSKPSFSLQKEPTSVYVSKVASLRQQFFFWRRDG